LPLTDQPWGVAGVRREARGAFADSRYFYVDPTNTTFQATDFNSGEDPEHPLLTIQRAVTLSRAYQGDVIYVLENDGWVHGTLTDVIMSESVIIPTDKPGLHLVGVGHGSMGVYWRPAATAGTCLTINALDIEVEGFCFTTAGYAAGNGISVVWNGATAHGDNPVIHDCTFDDTIDIAIQLEFCYYPHIYNCKFWECDTVGIYGDPAGTGSMFANIHDNLFFDCAVAIALTELDMSAIHHNTIYNALARAAAACTNQGIDITAGANDLVYENWFSCVLAVVYPDLNSSNATSGFVSNYCLNGMAIVEP
jgi:hypothetical protein